VSSVENPENPRGDEKFFLILVIGLALVVGAGNWFAIVVLSARDKVVAIPPDHPRELMNFALTNQNGREVTRDEVRGKVLAVSFLYTSCGLTCPEVSKRMTEIQKLTAGAEDVRLVSFTVDPRDDTTPVLAKWGTRYGADSNRWSLLTGDQSQLYRLIGTSFLTTDLTNVFNSMPGNFAGTERIAIVDKRGKLRAFFDGLRLETPAAAVKEINQLRNEN
jgi:protein SCO1/2